MSALFNSVDEMISKIKDEHEAEIKTMKDALLAAQLECELWKSRGREALVDRDAHMRVSTKLITQFGIVEKVFSDAKALALAHFTNVETEIKDDIASGIQKAEALIDSHISNDEKDHS